MLRRLAIAALLALLFHNAPWPVLFILGAGVITLVALYLVVEAAPRRAARRRARPLRRVS